MTLRAVVFDLGGVLELDVIELVDHGLDTRWEARLGLQAGELEQRMKPFWRAGSVGACTEEEVHQGMRERLGMSQEQVEEYMREMWDWYCGRLNVPLAVNEIIRCRTSSPVLCRKWQISKRNNSKNTTWSSTKSTTPNFVIYTCGQLEKPHQAIEIYSQVVEGYGEAPELELRQEVARGQVNKGFVLGQLGKTDEAIEATTRSSSVMARRQSKSSVCR